MAFPTNITMYNGIATFEDGTQIEVTVEQVKALPELIEAAERVFADAHDRGETHDKGSSELYPDWEALRAALAKARGE
jgi:hypothetical protein